MNKFVEIIKDQRTELGQLLKEEGLIVRERTSDVIVDSSLAQIVTGIRRCGKSVLCRSALVKAGVAFGYVNFDQAELDGITANDLNDVLKAVYIVYGDVDYLFFDEIQNVPKWQLWVNSLLRIRKRIVITGSNSRLLTDDLATHMTGRFIPTELLPFSFAECRAWLKRGEAGTTVEKVEQRRDYDRYFLNGGMPESFVHLDVRRYVETLYHSILLRDVLQRHRLRDTKRFMDTAYVIMNNFATEFSCNRLAGQLGIKNAVTVQTYVHYLDESYLIRTVRMYGSRAYERTRIGKVYAIDPGFISYFRGFSNIDDSYGRRLENIVFLQLYRMQRETDAEVFYWKDDRREIDFLLRRYNQIWKLIQVSYDISNEKTRKRELSALFAAGAKLKCSDLMLITDHENGEETQNGMTVKIVDVVTWLTESPSYLRRELR